jgi:hypothetical protein
VGEGGAEGTTVETLIIQRLDRMEGKLDDALNEHGRRLGDLETRAAVLEDRLDRRDSTTQRAVPWVALGWSMLVTMGGLLYALAHALPK